MHCGGGMRSNDYRLLGCCDLNVTLLCVANAVWLLATTLHVCTRLCVASSGNEQRFS